MVKAILVVGLAGSGKTLLSLSLFEWFKIKKQNVSVLNLDPGVIKVPYSPSIDIRNYINMWDLMEKYGIGPNSALIISMDLMLDYIEKINNEINSLNPDLLIVDTPGQMEIFAYRVSGKYFVDMLDVDEKMLIYVMDGVFVKDPRNLVSNILLASSVKMRFGLPMLIVLNKVDLMNKDEERTIKRLIKSSRYLEKELGKHYEPDEVDFLVKTFRYLKRYIGLTDYVPISAVTLENIDVLVQALTRVLFGGDEYIEL